MNHSNLPRYKWLTVLFFLCLVFLLAGLVALPMISNVDSIKRAVLSRVEAWTGLKIDVEVVHLKVLPRLQLELSNITIRDTASSDPLLTARRVIIGLSAHAVLRQELALKTVMVEHPLLLLQRDKSGGISVPRDENYNAGTKPTVGVGPLESIPMIQVIDGELVLTDKFGEKEQSLEISHLQGLISADSQKLTVNISLNGTVHEDVLEGTFAIVAVAEVLNTRHSDQAWQCHGTADLRNMNIHHLIDFMNRQANARSLPARINAKIAFDAAPSQAGCQLILPHIDLELAPVFVHGHARVDDLFANRPTFSVMWSSSRVTIDNVLHWVTLEQLPLGIQSLIHTQGLSGAIEVVRATATGALGTEPVVNVEGDFRVSDVQVFGPNGVAARGLSAKITVEEDVVKANELRGEYGPIAIQDGSAVVSHMRSEPLLSLNLKTETSASALRSFAMMNLSSPSVVRTLSTLTDMEGNIEAVFEISGPVARVKDLEIVRGEIDFRRIGFRTPLFPQPIHDMAGHIILTSSQLELPIFEASVGKSRLFAHGRMSTGKAVLIQGLSVRGQADIDEIRHLFSQKALSGITLHGTVDLAASIWGHVTGPHIKCTLDFTDTIVTIPTAFEKPLSVPASLDFDADLSDQEMLRLRKADLQVLNSHIVMRARIDKTAPNFEVRIESGNVSVRDLIPTISLGPLRDGLAMIALDISGRSLDFREWRIHGKAALQNGRIISDLFRAPLEQVAVKLSVSENQIDIEHIAFSQPHTKIQASGVISRWSLYPSVTLNVESSELDFASFLRLDRPGGNIPTIQQGIPDADVRVAIKYASYKNIFLTDVSGHLTIKDNTLRIDDIRGTTDDGSIEGHAVLPLLNREPRRGSFHLSGIPIERITTLLEIREFPLTGWLTVTGELVQEGPLSDLTRLRSSKDVMVLIEDGHVKGPGSISKIVGILNLPSLLSGRVDLAKDGFPFDKVILVFSLDRGTAVAKTIAMEGPVLQIGGTGRYEIPKDEVDLVLAVSPMRSYANLLKKIPLFKKVTGRDGYRLDAAMFSVKGPRSDPAVAYLPLQQLSNIMTGIPGLALDVLKNAVTQPVQLFAPAPRSTTDLNMPSEK